MRSAIQRVCIQSNAFGLSCLESQAGDLDIALKEADKLAAEFNETAKLTRLIVYSNIYRVEQDDARAIAQINKNIRELMDSMAEGLQNLDVEKVRAAANDAKALGGMLTDSAKAEVQAAV